MARTFPVWGNDRSIRLRGRLAWGSAVAADLMRLYVRPPGRSGIIGADIRLTDTPTALIAALPFLIEEEERHQPTRDDPHCDLLVELTDW